MCGPTQQQKDVTDEQQQFYKKLTDEYSTIFGQNQAITGALTGMFTPILQAGPGQPGLAAGLETALRTQNTENVATDYAQAQKATAQILAARGGGDTLLPSSVNANILAQNANAAAATRAQGEMGITQANYAQGYQNWNTAANVLGSTAGLLNPTGYAGQATGAGTAASTSAQAVAASQFAPWGAAMGALGAVGGAAVGKLPPMGCWIAAELFGGWYEPRTVLVRNWLWNDFNRLWIGRKLLGIYLKYGARIAEAIRVYPSLRILFSPLFNLALRQAKRR
jgi:hypothetical protein